MTLISKISIVLIIVPSLKAKVKRDTTLVFIREHFILFKQKASDNI